MCSGLDQASAKGGLPQHLAEDFEPTQVCDSDTGMNHILRSRFANSEVEVINKAEDLLDPSLGLVKPVQCVITTLPCIGETVARDISSYSDSTAGLMFRSGHIQLLATAYHKPVVVAAELTSPHPNSKPDRTNINAHVTIEKDMAAMGYSSGECSAVINSAFYRGATSQARWIRVWTTQTDITKCDLRSCEIQGECRYMPACATQVRRRYMYLHMHVPYFPSFLTIYYLLNYLLNPAVESLSGLPVLWTADPKGALRQPCSC